MPAGFLPDEGIQFQLECILKRPLPGILPWTLILFVNDLNPDFDVTLDDLEEATWSGYSRVTLDRSNWTTTSVADGCAHAVWGNDAIVWYVTGGPVQTNYGYAYVDFTTDEIRFIQRFDAEDIRPVQVGGKVTLLPMYTLTSAECDE